MTGISGLEAFGAICVLVFLLVLLHAHREKKNPIDLTDLITDWTAGGRKISRSAFAAFGGFLVGTWAFLYCVIGGTLGTSWEGIGVFMAMCFGYRGVDTYLKNQRDATAPESVAIEAEAKKKGLLS